MEPARTTRLVLEALAQIDGGGQADRVLARALRGAPDLSSGERRDVARRVLGTACLRGRLDYLVRAAGARPSPAWRLAAYLATEDSLPAAEAARLAGLDDASALERLRAGGLPWPEDPVERLAAERSLPHWLARLWIEQFGPTQADALVAAMNRPGPITARANRLRCTRSELRAALAEEGISAVEGRLAPDALHLEGRPNVFGSRAWRAGLFEVQDEGSQLVAQLAAAAPGQKVVDFCAGAGGKTLALAAQMQNRGTIVALDVNPQRLADLRPRLTRAGVQIVQALCIDPEGPPPPCALGADVVLVDAPCSSLGTLRRGPDARWRVREEEVAAFPSLQRAILQRAAACVRPGGRLIYATCTLNRAENEEVADAFTRDEPRFEPLAPRLEVRPDREGCDGFFGASWRLA